MDSRLADQCMAGAMGERHPVKKKTGVVASDQRLLQPFEKFICDGSHRHGNQNGPASRKLQIWPWRFAQAAADGIEHLIATKYRKHGEDKAYPTAENQHSSE